jgi:amino acid transporter
MRLDDHGHSRRFGTAPVFLTAISTILGAVMFLRFGYAVGNLGFIGTLGIILLGHLVTIPTAMAIAEIATNQRVQGGGEYYIISRSFGSLVGASVGTVLYLSQAISVAFYIIAFGEAFRPVFDAIQARWSVGPLDPRLVTVPAALLIAILMLTKGASLGVQALYVVVGTLFASLVCFFLGRPTDDANGGGMYSLVQTVANPDPFFTVFAICFPAFTGMTAGVGLSGDLKNPQRSIPLGTLGATLTGMFVYVAIAWKLSISATPRELVGDQLIMSRIALWGPIIPIGLACATISSALGSILVAPRTLQALANDRVFPGERMNTWLARGSQWTNEPVRATLVTSLIALVFVMAGNVNFVAKIISMIFMVTYGSLCMVSFLQHFAADPSYRPRFRSRWYISLFGAAMCLWLMFSMSPLYAALSIVMLGAVYLIIS